MSVQIHCIFNCVFLYLLKKKENIHKLIQTKMPQWFSVCLLFSPKIKDARKPEKVAAINKKWRKQQQLRWEMKAAEGVWAFKGCLTSHHKSCNKPLLRRKNSEGADHKTNTRTNNQSIVLSRFFDRDVTWELISVAALQKKNQSESLKVT